MEGENKDGRKRLGVLHVMEDCTTELVEGRSFPWLSTRSMGIDMDDRVMRVVSFMQRSLPVDDLRGVAEAIAMVAPVIWSNHAHISIRPMRLSEFDPDGEGIAS